MMELWVVTSKDDKVVFAHPFEKYAEAKLDHFPRVRGEHIKCLKPPPRQQRREHEVPQSGGLKMSMFFLDFKNKKQKHPKQTETN